jgi:hypothetical protein
VGDPDKIEARTEEYRAQIRQPLRRRQPGIHRRPHHAARHPPPPLPLARHAAREAAEQSLEEARQYSAVERVSVRWNLRHCEEASPTKQSRTKGTSFVTGLIRAAGNDAVGSHCSAIRSPRRAFGEASSPVTRSRKRKGTSLPRRPFRGLSAEAVFVRIKTTSPLEHGPGRWNHSSSFPRKRESRASDETVAPGSPLSRGRRG